MESAATTTGSLTVSEEVLVVAVEVVIAGSTWVVVDVDVVVVVVGSETVDVVVDVGEVDVDVVVVVVGSETVDVVVDVGAVVVVVSCTAVDVESVDAVVTVEAVLACLQTLPLGNSSTHFLAASSSVLPLVVPVDVVSTSASSAPPQANRRALIANSAAPEQVERIFDFTLALLNVSV